MSNPKYKYQAPNPKQCRNSKIKGSKIKMKTQNEEILERGGCIMHIPIVKERIPSRRGVKMGFVTPLAPS